MDSEKREASGVEMYLHELLIRPLWERAAGALVDVLRGVAVLADQQLGAVAKEIAEDRARKKRARQNHGNHAYDLEKRERLVAEFKQARANGEAENIEAWAQMHANVDPRTFRRWRRDLS